MNISKINKFDVANGAGVRTSVFVSGCDFKCNGCFNSEAQNFCYGERLNKDKLLEIVNNLKDNNVVGLSVLGGEPMHPNNLEGVDLIISLAKFTTYEFKDVWLWTGYEFEELLKRTDGLTMKILNSIDVLIDGQFEIGKRDLSLKYKGSSNQRVINVKESLKQNKVILWEK